MKRLILMRHAKTEPWHRSNDDHDRPLTARGRKTACAVAEALADKGWIPDTAVVSTAMRAEQTWACAATIFANSSMIAEDRLYLADQSDIARLIADHDKTETLMIIGHNPGLHNLALRLAGSAHNKNQTALTRIAEAFPPGSAALFATSQAVPFQSENFKLVDFIHPHRVVMDKPVQP